MEIIALSVNIALAVFHTLFTGKGVSLYTKHGAFVPNSHRCGNFIRTDDRLDTLVGIFRKQLAAFLHGRIKAELIDILRRCAHEITLRHDGFFIGICFAIDGSDTGDADDLLLRRNSECTLIEITGLFFGKVDNRKFGFQALGFQFFC